MTYPRRPESGENSCVPEGDLHGERTLVRNIVTNWGAQLIQMASGFVVPRLIDGQISQEALGVWDLAWSIVVYFNLIQMGITSSINRYVAFHRARSDYEGINRVISSVVMIMRGMSTLVLILTAVFSWLVPVIFQQRLGSYVIEARWLVFFLGLNVAVQISVTIYSSILTGCHRWDWHNGIHAGTNLVTLLGMIGVLLLGQGLIALAIVTLLGESLGRMARIWVVYRLCPWLQIHRRHFRVETAREMFSFGGKTFTTQVSQLVMNSSINIMIAAYLGPAALAFYARPLSLLRNIGVFVNKYAMVFSPTISSLQAAKRDVQVRDLSLKATRYGLFAALPPLIFLLVFGAEVMHVWMGGNYADPWLVSLMVVGFLCQICHIPLFKALVGLNHHGQPGIVNLVTALVTIGLVYVFVGVLGYGVIAAASCVAFALSITNGVYLPIYASRKLRISLAEFWREVWRTPALSVLPFTVCLVASRLSFSSPFYGAVCGVCTGGVTLFVCYWKTALPARWKLRISNRVFSGKLAANQV